MTTPNKTIEKKGENWRKGYQVGYKDGVLSALRVVEFYKPHINKDGLLIRKMLEGSIKKLLSHTDKQN